MANVSASGNAMYKRACRQGSACCTPPKHSSVLKLRCTNLCVAWCFTWKSFLYLFLQSAYGPGCAAGVSHTYALHQLHACFALAQAAAPFVTCNCSAGATKANVPCHKTTGSDVELKDLSSWLGSGLYTVGSDRGEIEAKQMSSSAEAVTRCHQRRCHQRLVGTTVGSESFASVSSAMRIYFALDMLR